VRSFSAFIGATEIRFVGNCWKDGGFFIDEDGDPKCDYLGNSVSRHTITEIDERDADLLAQAYSGDEPPDREGFIAWMAVEGIPAQVRKNVADAIMRT